MLVNQLQRSLLVCLILLALAGCSTVVRVPGDTGRSTGAENATPVGPSIPPAFSLDRLREAEQAYATVLTKYVDERGRVGFAALADDTSATGLPALEHYVRMIGEIPLEQLPAGAPRLAHMINAYNALSMYNVIRSGLPANHDGLNKIRFFLLRKFLIGGQLMSLYSFENDIIRKLNDPRIHFALNCSAVSCPVLPRVPFPAAGLDEVLDLETRKFFARAENLRLDPENRTVYFNEILKFYTEDFTPSHAPTLIAYARRYSRQSIPEDYRIAFAPYDWSVVHRP